MKDIFKLDDIKEEIAKADETQSAVDLADDLKKNKEAILALNQTLQDLCKKTDTLIPAIDKGVKDMQNASTINIPPQVIEHLKDIFDTFCRIFASTLDKQGKNSVMQLDDRLEIIKQRMTEHEKKIARYSERIAMSYSLFYCFSTSFILLAIFFGIVFWANVEIFRIERLQNLIWVFLGIIIICNAAIIGFTAWRNRK